MPQGAKIIGQNQSCLVMWERIVFPNNKIIDIKNKTFLSEIVPINITKKESDFILKDNSKIHIDYYPSCFIQNIK